MVEEDVFRAPLISKYVGPVFLTARWALQELSARKVRKMPSRLPDDRKAAMPLGTAQIAAAGALRASLRQWQTTDQALSKLREVLPGFGPTETLLKVVAINGLYGTNVLALTRAARHVQKVLASVDLTRSGPALVESLAEIPTTPHGRPRRHISFASKFAHFFCDPERFPIYDAYAERMVTLHLGPAATRNPARPYEAFTTNVDTLKRQYRLTHSFRELDGYLWIAGLYRAYLQGDRRLNAELLRVFEKPTDQQRALLRKLRAE